MIEAAPTDVIAVWTGSGLTQDMIRLADLLEGKPAVANHVVGVTHRDKLGRWMGLEGRPGGFGLVDVTPYLSDPRSRSNHDQPRTAEQVTFLLAYAAKLTGTPYDWLGIDEDGLRALDMAALAAEVDRAAGFIDHSWAQPGLLPGHVVCSSSWDYAYAAAPGNLAHPAVVPVRDCTPGDWWDYNDRRLWPHG